MGISEETRKAQGTTIGFVGLGAMGAPMATNLLRAGHPVRVWNRTTKSAEPIVALGAALATTPRELGATCDVILTMVSDGRDVEAVALGEDGLLTQPRSGLLWIDCSSIAPQVAISLADKARLQGVEPVDAPVSGGTRGATEGTLSIMVGGTTDGVTRARPILDLLGSNIVHVGANGAGQVTKLVNQLIVGGTIALVSEGLALSEGLGCSPVAVRDALAGGFADSRVLQVHGQRMIDSTFEPGFKSSLQLKDLRNVLDAAGSVGVALPVTAVVQQLYTALSGIGLGKLDHSAIAILERRLSGLAQ